MRSLTTQSRRGIRTFCVHFVITLSCFFSVNSYAQNGAPCYKPLIGPGTSARVVENGVLQVNSGLFTPLANITDGNTDNYASNTAILGAISNTGVSVLSDQTFPDGWRAGFVVEFTGGLLTAAVLNAITLRTLNNGSVVDTKTSGTGLGVTLLGGTSGKLYLNFASSGSFNEVQLLLNSGVNVSLSSLRVYNAMAFDPNCGNNENNNFCEDQIAGPGTTVSYNGGLLNLLTSLINPNNIIDGNRNTSAALGLPAGTGILSTPVYVGVTDVFNVYPAGNKAGFVIRANSALLNADVLNNVKIQTYLFGEFVGEAIFNNGTGLLNLSALSTTTNDKKKLEFTSPGKFNEVRIVFGSGIDVNTATTDIFYAYESGPTCPDCVFGLYDDYPAGSPYLATVVDSETGLVAGGLGACVLAGISGEDNVVTSSQGDFATISALIGLNCTGRITVQRTTAGTYPLGSFAGFEIARNNGGLLGLLSLSALDAITVRAYNGNTPVGSSTGASLLTGGVLAGVGGKTLVGFKPTAAFNKIRIEIDMGLVSLATTYRIYRAVVILDTDGDGTPDCIDQCAGSDAIDSDGDGTPDNCDQATCVSPNNNKSASIDTDGDGLFNNCDDDSDNDGIPDTVEDTNGNGNPNDDDADGDGIPNYLDLDSDNDGILDLYESGLTTAQISANDPDGNGVLNGQNPVAVATPRNTDGDGVPDYLDLDSDNDGIKDLTESGRTGLVDANNDGVVDGPDGDNDGVQDSADGSPALFGSLGTGTIRDTDGDAVPDYRDLDSDNDGIKDLTESGIAGATDANNDGVVDGPDADNDGIQDSVDSQDGTFGSPGVVALTNTDGDTVPNYLDLDSDNDGIKDLVESGITGFVDANNDGVVDGPDADNDGIQDSVDSNDAAFGSPGATVFADTDGDTVPNYLDLDSDNDGIKDLYESGLTGFVDANNDGVVDGPDADNDGIQDSVDSNDSAFGSSGTPPGDADGDLVPNYLDLDSDNDGIKDLTESGITGFVDANNDGVVDGPDADNDGIQDSVDSNDALFGSPNDAAPRNTDGDSRADFLDLDSDNDGIKDLTESGLTGFVDANNDGVVEGPDADNDGIQDSVDSNDAAFGSPGVVALTNTDGDTVPNYLDLDSDNDGIKDLYESGLTGFVDANNDGVVDGPDADNDGIQDSVDSNDSAFGSPGTPPGDADGDTVPNYLDLDSDNDGIKDLTESGITGFVDANNDGVVDGPDADNDGIQDSVDSNDSAFGSPGDAAPRNTDGDGVADFLDLDSDNDGINDLTESGITGATDANNDGVVDGPDADSDGIRDSVDSDDATFGSPGVVVLTNTDGDTTPNYLDLDSDNDGIKDLTESGITGFVDANNDGVVDGPDADNDGIQDSVDSNDAAFGSPGATVFADTDGDTVPNYLDLDSDNDGIRDLYESGLTGFVDANNDGVVDGPDADNDGIQDSVDSNDSAFGSSGTGTPIDSDGDTIPDVRDLDSDNDGINDIVENGNPAAVDANGDGMVDGPDADKDGILGGADTNDGVFGSPGSPAPLNSDNDPLPNFQDLDSDNDSVSDLVESGQTGYTDSPQDGVVDGPDTDGDGIQDSVDGAPNTFGDANSPAPKNTDNTDTPDYIDTDSNNDGTNDIASNGNGGLDGNNDGMVDNPTDPDNDGIANNGGLDQKPTEFGGLGAAAGLPDLTPSVLSNGGTYNANEQKDVVIAIFNIGPDATAGPVTFEINKIGSAFSISINPTAITSTVTGQLTVANDEWTFTEEFARYVVTLKDGFSIPAGGNKKIVIQVSATNTPNAAATITARVFNGTGGGETPITNNSAVYLVNINNSNN
jgi:hypothetical protein